MSVTLSLNSKAVNSLRTIKKVDSEQQSDIECQGYRILFSTGVSLLHNVIIL